MRRRIYSALLASLLSFVTYPCSGATPAEQFRSLLKDYHAAAASFRDATTDNERRQAVRRLDEYPHRFIDIAEAPENASIALEALRQATQSVISVDSLARHAYEINEGNYPAGSQGDAASRIVQILIRDHLDSSALGPICDRMRWGIRNEFATFLTAVLQANPDRDVQGLARLALGQLRSAHLRMIELARDRPELRTQYDFLYGDGYFEAILGDGQDALIKRIESHYEQALEYQDVTNIPFDSSVADKAKTELYELRNLSPGNLAPYLSGIDQEGNQLALSDYEGKVVLLYFWHEY